ncbi:glycosyltransferase domain-containing protein [Methanobrevibacter sp.]|uniref:glycosyltransferase domain-containing protein n=1 Tax=Methanobrevibacter sp. TaxID=66852 RepID=UPI00388E66E3
MSYDEIYEEYQKLSKEHVNRPLFDHTSGPADETIEDIKNNKLAIYTAFTGDYDTLKEPEVIDENCDYICFTDNPDLESDLWKIIPMEDSILDNNRKAKQYKLLPHKYLKDYKYSFWLDGTFKIKGSIREYIYKNIKADSKMLVVVHTERDCVYEEYKASKIIPRYPRAVMEEQVEYYRSQGFPKNYGLGVMGALFRQHNHPDVVKLMDDWWDENIKYTNQDQLSFAYVCWKNDFHPSVSRIYYWENEYWAKEGQNYHHKVVLTTPITSDNLRAKIGVDVENMELGDTIELSREELYLLVNDVKGMAGYRIDTAGRIGFLQNEYNEFINSNSLKLTKPLRVAGDLARKVKNNHYLQSAKNSKTSMTAELGTYDMIKGLGILNETVYGQVHPCHDPVLHFIENGSKTDSIDDKIKYIDPIFDLYYYISVADIGDKDPLIHYIDDGFRLRIPFNRKYPNFLTNLNENIHVQLDRFANKRIKSELNNNHYITDSKVLIDYIVTHKEFKTDTIKVGVFLEDNFDNMNACPYIRLHTPFSKLAESGDYHFFIYGQEIMPLLDIDNMINAHIFDVIVIQRVNPYSNILLKKAKKHNIKIVYESDDDFMDINPANPSYNYILGNFDNIKKLVTNVDQITVSTNELKERFDKLGLKNVEIIKNYYVNDSLPLKPFAFRGNEFIKIGYFGTLTHDNDLELIHNVILRLKDIFSKKGITINFEIAGASIDEKSDWFTVKKIPYYPMSMKTFYDWLGKNSEWDIGIIPLVNTEFNKCKSELKYIEFSALGIPVVASDMNVYNEAIEDGVTGFLANNEDEWVNKLSMLIEDPILRNGIVNNARRDILENYNLKSRVNQWDEIFKRLKD